jgi:DNA-binding NarL/FixJ family response regulator
MHSLKVGIVDDHNLFLKGFRLLLESLSTMLPLKVVLCCHTEEELVSKLSEEEVDLMFVDLNLVYSDGIQLISKLKTWLPGCRILVVSMSTDPKLVRDAFKHGADGYLSKFSEEEDLLKAIQVVTNGGIYMGPGIQPNVKTEVEEDIQPRSVLVNRFNAKFLLTKREFEILEKILEGKTSKAIATELFISRETVTVHRRNLMKKMGVTTVIHLVNTAREYNLL